MNKKIVDKIFPDLVKKVEQRKCPFCNKNINENDFKDKLSRKEYEISGICQECQDDFFEGY